VLCLRTDIYIALFLQEECNNTIFLKVMQFILKRASELWNSNCACRDKQQPVTHLTLTSGGLHVQGKVKLFP